MSLTYFTDRDLGKAFPRVLANAGMDVRLHDDEFPQNTPDEVWLAEVGRRGWVAVTHDGRIRYKPNERQAVIAHGVALLLVVGSRVPFELLARSFVATRTRVERFLVRHRPPLIAKVYRASPSELDRNPLAAGRVELWYPKR